MKTTMMITAAALTAATPSLAAYDGPDMTLATVARAVEGLARDNGVAPPDLAKGPMTIGDALIAAGGVEGISRGPDGSGALRHPGGGLITVGAAGDGYEIALKGMSPGNCARILRSPSPFPDRQADVWIRPDTEVDDAMLDGLTERAPDALLNACIGVEEIAVSYDPPMNEEMSDPYDAAEEAETDHVIASIAAAAEQVVRAHPDWDDLYPNLATAAHQLERPLLNGGMPFMGAFRHPDGGEIRLDAGRGFFPGDFRISLVGVSAETCASALTAPPNPYGDETFTAFRERWDRRPVHTDADAPQVITRGYGEISALDVRIGGDRLLAECADLEDVDRFVSVEMMFSGGAR